MPMRKNFFYFHLLSMIYSKKKKKRRKEVTEQFIIILNSIGLVLEIRQYPQCAILVLQFSVVLE